MSEFDNELYLRYILIITCANPYISSIRRKKLFFRRYQDLFAYKVCIITIIKTHEGEVQLLKRFALLLFPLSSVFFSLFALTLTVNVGRDDGENFSTIHIKEDLPFKCLSEKDEFDDIKQIQCVFPREPKEKFEKMQKIVLPVCMMFLNF